MVMKGGNKEKPSRRGKGEGAMRVNSDYLTDSTQSPFVKKKYQNAPTVER